MSKTDWFSTANLGLFIHYDHASQQGIELSWPILGLPYYTGVRTAAEYHASAATFDPVRWQPAELAAKAAAAGMTYAVFTSKHHSGWASWPSKVAPFTIASSPYGKRGGDLVREYADAFRSAGIRVGLYFSLSDWSHPDYPAWTDDQRPYLVGTSPVIRDQARWQQFRSTLKAELTELLTWYGPIELLWFDGQWERTAEVWGTADLRDHIHSLAPNIVINDRLTDAGDYATPEQAIPGEPPDGPWETCLTMSDYWGYVPTDDNYKSIGTIVRSLVEVVSKGGNLLLNVGPRADGTLPSEQRAVLEGMAAWMAVNSAAIHGTRPLHGVSVLDGGWLRWTRRGDHAYAILADVTSGDVTLAHRPGLLDPATAVRLDGGPVTARSIPDGTLITVGETGAMPVVVRFLAY